MKNKAKSAKATFTKCHRCHSTSLTIIGCEVFCDDCEWNSIEASVEAGSMDNLFSAYMDHFYCDDLPSVEKSKPAKQHLVFDDEDESDLPAKVS